MSAFGFGAVLLAIWLLLWGSLSVANVATGVLVVLGILWVLPEVRLVLRAPAFRPLSAARLLARIVVDLFRANVVVTREILSPGSSINTGVVGVPLTGCTDGLLTLVANVLALTPGTMPLEVTREPPAIYVHLLHMRDAEVVRRDIQELAALAVRAFGSREAVAAIEASRSGASPDPAAVADEP